MSQEFTPQVMAQYIDHTLLRPDATEGEIFRICDEALEFKFKAICIEKKWLPAAIKRLGGAAVIPATVISFPHGNSSTEEKCREVREALDAGARELDMVMNRELLAQKKYLEFYLDTCTVVNAARGTPVKVILETSELSSTQKILACGLIKAAGARFVKTSTGFSKGGATEEDVRLMREIVGEDTGVKASGGIRDYDTAVRMIKAGASRLGTSASVAIVKGHTGSSGGY